MLFVLSNALVDFMDLINHVFCMFLDRFIIVFIDDILVYLRIKEECVKHLRKVL